MEFEQIVKQLDWLDKEQRKSKSAVSSLEERLSALETSVNAFSKQLKTIGKQLTEISHATSRLNQFDDMMAKQRADLKKAIDENEKRGQKREKDISKQFQAELEDIRKALTEINLKEIKKNFKDRASESQRLSDIIAELKERVEAALHENEKAIAGQKLADEARKQDLKRIADIQGEMTAMRKRSDENREKILLHDDNFKNVEGRVNELLSTEMDRKQAQTAFLEQQTLAQVERDRAWKEWREKFDAFKNDMEQVEGQLQALDETMRAAKKAQESYLDLNTKLERRISEITEMQRLAEDRLRQEWIAFKADDQKRWTGYTLSSEESIRDMRKDMTKLEERMTALDESSLTAQDQLHQVTDVTEKQLQEFMNVTHEWMTAYERIMGHGKAKKIKK